MEWASIDLSSKLSLRCTLKFLIDGVCGIVGVDGKISNTNSRGHWNSRGDGGGGTESFNSHRRGEGGGLAFKLIFSFLS